MISLGFRLLCGAVFGVVAISAAAEEHSATSAGRGLFLRNCAPCHGDDGRGKGPNASLFLSKPRDLREGFLDTYDGDDLVRRVLDGRPLSLAVDVTALRRQSKEVGAIDQHIRKIAAVDWVAVENGWAIFAERCGACHGPFGESQGDLPPGVRAPRDLASAEFQKSLDDRALGMAVSHGRKGMPALVPRLRGADVGNVVAFVRILGPGFQSYSKYCGHCHGDDGVGVGNFDPGVGAPAITFDSEYIQKVDPIRFRESIWHMLRLQKPSMPHFRKQITEAETRAILDYLRSLPPS